MKSLDELKSLVNAALPTKVLALTYRSVEGWKAGSFQPSPNLQVQVLIGGYEPYMGTGALGAMMELTAFEQAMTTGNPLVLDAVMEVERAAANNAFTSMAAGLQTVPNTPVLALVYAGLQVFDDAFGLARAIKERHLENRVVVVTCDCDKGKKHGILSAAMAVGAIDDYFVTNSCGGADAMGEALDLLVEVFTDQPGGIV